MLYEEIDNPLFRNNGGIKYFFLAAWRLHIYSLIFRANMRLELNPIILKNKDLLPLNLACCTLNGYSRLSLSRIPRDSLKHFEISIPLDIGVAEVRKTINRTTTFNK